MHRAPILASVIVVALLLIVLAPVHAQDATPLATPSSAQPTGETLLDATINHLPTGHVVVEVDRWRLRPSPRALTMPPLAGPVLVAVESGDLTATVDGVAHQLAAGEHLVLAGNQGGAFQPVGSDEVIAFFVYVIPGFASSPNWDYDQVADTVDWLISTSADALPGGPGRVVLERLTLPPGSALPRQEAAPLVWIEVGEGELGLTLGGEQLPFRWKSGTERTFRPAQYLPTIHPGTQMTLRNAGDDALVLYRLTLTPAPAEALAPGTTAPAATAVAEGLGVRLVVAVAVVVVPACPAGYTPAEVNPMATPGGGGGGGGAGGIAVAIAAAPECVGGAVMSGAASAATPAP